MSAPETPKFSAPHRRSGRPRGYLSPLHSAIAIGLVLLAFGLFLLVMAKLRG